MASINLFANLADALRERISTLGFDVGDVENDSHAAVRLWSKIRRYQIDPHPRRINKAVGFSCPEEHTTGIRQLEKAIEDGEDLKPYRSNKVARLADDTDDLLDYWKIHHFHLGSTIGDRGFVERTNELLFCRVEEDCVFFIKSGNS